MTTSPTSAVTQSRRRWLIGAGGVSAVLTAGVVFTALRSVPQPATSVATAATADDADDADDAVQAALARGKPVVAEFGSVSCVSCREMKPILAELARTHGHKLTVVDVDVLKERKYLARYRIRLMPTQVFFDAQGRELGRHMGTISGDEILARLGATNR